MSYHQPKDWVLAVLLRFDKLLESSVTQNVSLPSQLEEHKACLINSSQSKCSSVISGLTASLKKLFSIRIYGERQEFNLYNAQIIVLDVLEKCITSKDSLPEDSNLMRMLLPEICQLLYQPSNDKPVVAQLQASASRVLYCISQHNFNVVFNKISTKLQDLTLISEEAVDMSDLELIHHMYIDLSRITLLLEEIGLRFRNLRKPAQMTLAASLDKALWKWLCSYPAEFNLLYQHDSLSNLTHRSSVENVATTSLMHQKPITDEQRTKISHLSAAAEKLFDLLDNMTEGSKKKAALCWPLQTMLLVLCPNLLKQIVNGQESVKTGKHELLNQLRKVVTGRHILESCADSYIRLLKVATCIQEQNYKQSALEKLVNGFLYDLQIYLFENGSKYFMKTLDQEALVECFVSSFRLFHKKDNLVKLCASSNASIHLKMTLVQAMHCISTQPYLEWWPRIEKLYNYSSNIRKILHECVEKVQAQGHASPRSSQSLREKMERMNVGLKRSQDELPTYKDLLLVVLQLIQGNPLIVLKEMGSCSQEVHGTAMKLFTVLSSLFTVQNTSNFPLSFESLGALLRLHDPQIIPMWNPEQPLSTLWDVSSTVLYTVCDTLLRNQMITSPEKSSHAIKWIHEILTCRTSYFLANQEKNLFNYKSEIVKKAQLKLEVTLLAHLWHSNSEVVMLALSCFQCFHEELELSLSTIRSYPEHYNVYHELASIPIMNEDVSIQQRVANVFRRVRKFPPAALQAWENLREKWEKLVLSSYKHSREDSPVNTASAGDSPIGSKVILRKCLNNQQEVADWINLTRFLCALGGVCAKTSDQNSTMRQVRSISTSHATVTHSSASPDLSCSHKRSVMGPRTSLAESRTSRFLTLLLNVMASSHLKATEINNLVRDLLGNSLHPALHPSLFQQIKVFLKSVLLDSSSHMVMNKNNDKLVEHLVVMLRRIFEQCSDQDAEYLSEESTEGMILNIVRYVRHTGTSKFAYQLRIKFCNMIGEMMKRKNDLFFLSEIHFRNKLIEHLTDWIMTSINQEAAFDRGMARDLDESAIDALGIVLNGLPLHPDEGDGGDVPQAKSSLFLKYFTLFMKLLSECAEEQRSNERIDENVVASKQTATLRKALIVAMSNMLSANIEYGLVHAMSLAYHNDVQTRAAFLEVLIKILQQGTAGFKSLSDSVLAERFERLVELVTMMGDNGELPIANALANVVHTTYMDELARVFVTLFDAKHLLYQLLWNMFSKEVEESDTVQTLFRGNSLASKIMTFCFKVYGASYLHNLVEPLVAWSMSPDIMSLQFEIDQKRIPPGVDIKQCRINLLRLTERFFSRIMTSTDKFPPQLKSVCHCLYQVVSQRFHEKGTGAVASAIFLRFLNPAIATPYECGLSEKPPPPNLAKAFKFMCKIMQNIANHVVFTKEEHMKPFNDFVRARFDVCQQFFMQISTPECSSIENVVHSTSYVNDTNVAALHRLLWNDQEKIGLFLARSKTAKAVGRRPFDKMVTLLAYLGPPEYTRPVLETRVASQNISPCEFEELMIRRKVADSKEYKMAKSLNIFYQFGRSKMGYPVFYYIARRYKQADIHEDILKFYILQALKSYSARKFDVVFDLTQVGPNNSLRHLCTWLSAFPHSVYKNLDSVYIYNPNSWFLEYASYNEETFNKLIKHQKIYFFEALFELQKFIDIDHLKIPAATRSLDEDLTCYFHAYKSGATKVDIKVGTKAIQITTVDRVKLLDQEVILNDIYYSHEIESIEPYHESMNSFTLSANNSLLLFTHPESIKIIESIRHIRARWELTQPVQDLSTHHTISAKDVPGTLLNMALLNLGCSHPMVRSCAYNLLCCLTHSFSLQLEGRLYQSEGLCIPVNNTLFIVSISSTLARNESHLTLEFLKECITGFCCSTDKLKNLCLEYMEPWLFNLPSFINSVEANQKVRAIIYQLIDLTIAEKNFYPSVQTKIWGNIGRMADITDLALECFFEASLSAGLGSIKAEVMADTSVALATHNMKLVSSKIISRLCYIVDKTSLRPTPTLEKHKHWDEIAILARYLLMLSFNNNLDVVTHLPYLFHLVSLLLSTGPLSLRASIHGLVVNIIHSLLTCRELECKDETQQMLRLSLTEFCLPKFYLFFGISNVASAADTAFKSESFVHGQPLIGKSSHSLPIGSGSKTDEDSVNLCFLDIVVDALLEVLEACLRDMSTSRWLSDWQDLSEKFAFQYNPSLQPRALVVLGCISKKVSMAQIKQILNILSRSVESHADPILLEASILCLTRLQLLLKSAPHDFHCVFFWIGICAMQFNDKNLYAAGLSLIEQNLHNLDDMGALSMQAFSSVLMKCRAKVERYFHPLEAAININFHPKFHYAFVSHLMKGFRHPDSLVVTRVVRVLDFSLEILSRFKNTHKYEVNEDSAPYLAALLPISPEVRRHCFPRKKTDSTADSQKSSISSKLSNGRHSHMTSLNGQSATNLLDVNDSDTPSNASQSSRNLHAPIPEDEVVSSSLPRASVTSSDSKTGYDGKSLRRLSKRNDNHECGTTPPKLRKIVDGAQDSDSSTSSGSHMSSLGSHRKPSSEPGSNVLLDDEVLDQNSQALLLTILAAHINHAASTGDVEVVFEYLAQASVCFPTIFPIVHNLLDQKISNVLESCDDASILSHVQIVVHNALLIPDRERTHRQLSLLEGIGFGGIWRFTRPFDQVANLEHAHYFVKLIDQFMGQYLSDVSDLCSAPSRHSLNSDLSAASADDIQDTDTESEMDDEISELSPQNSPPVDTTQPGCKSGSFRNKKPNLTIKVPN